MDKRYICLVSILVFIFSFTTSMTQEKSKKQLKEEKKVAEEKETTILINSKEFVFVANSVSPQGGRFVILTDYYAIEYHLDLIKSDLPFFGTAYSGIGYGGGGNGMQFEGKPEKWNVEKTKKGYTIKTEVKGENDFYSLLLSVDFGGSAYLSIVSNKRSPISYNGNVKVLEKK